MTRACLHDKRGMSRLVQILLQFEAHIHRTLRRAGDTFARVFDELPRKRSGLRQETATMTLPISTSSRFFPSLFSARGRLSCESRWRMRALYFHTLNILRRFPVEVWHIHIGTLQLSRALEIVQRPNASTKRWRNYICRMILLLLFAQIIE